jgi:threonine dehydratase
MLTLDDVCAAADNLRGRVHRTPLLGSRTLGQRLGTGAWLKAELFQRTGSFKIRGALNRVGAIDPAERARGVITVSAGNHAQAVALACRESGIDALVLMPFNASPAKVAAAREYGATVDLESGDAAEAFARMVAISEESGRQILHPYDDSLVMAGQGTVGLEICEDAPPETDVVVVPVGGGGLISGIATAVAALRPGTRLVGVQPEATATLGPSLAAGRPVRSPGGRTIADALTAPVIGDRCLEVCARLVDQVVTITEAELTAGTAFVYERAKLACEAAAAAPVAALLAGKVDLDGRSGVVAVVSGGNIARSAVADVMTNEEDA